MLMMTIFSGSCMVVAFIMAAILGYVMRRERRDPWFKARRDQLDRKYTEIYKKYKLEQVKMILVIILVIIAIYIMGPVPGPDS